MTQTTLIGQLAETIAADFLHRQGYEIVGRNWKTRWCEIDIIARKRNTVYFVEVKYRAGSKWGSGLEVITETKRKQMAFAATFWVNDKGWEGPYALSAIEVSGEPMQVTNFIESIED